ncbi:MAG TPA: hypothetical protein VFZ64_06295 [Nocardioidaceae bacterium]
MTQRKTVDSGASPVRAPKKVPAVAPKRGVDRTRSAPPTAEPLITAIDLWRSVVLGLRGARYDEIGIAYTKLSTLLVQQRVAELVSGEADRGEWSDLRSTAEEALQLLEPVTTAARQLAALPSRVDLDAHPNAVPRETAPTTRKRAAQRRTPKKS